MLNIWPQQAAGPPAARERDDLYRRLLENMSEAVFLVDQADVILFANPSADRMFGYAPGELIGRHVSVLNAYPDEQSRLMIAQIDAILKDKGAWQGEFRNRSKDGREFLTASLISTIEVDGRPHFLCVSQDITERRRVEKAMRESESRMDLATRASDLGVWDLDLVTGAVVYSPRALAIFGQPQDRPVDVERVRAQIHPDDREFTAAQRSRSLDPAIRERLPYEYRIILPDGEVRWVRAHGEAIFEEVEGEVRAIRYVGTLEDVHEARLAAERLRLLTAEVDHRANNLMTVVQAAVRLTKADTLEDYRRILNGRIGALANAHRLLAKSRWQGADLFTLIEEEMKPYRLGDASRVTIEGPDLSLSAQAAQCLSMAVHELGTNAAKYGALAAGGVVAVSWRLTSGRDLVLEWRERGAKPPAGEVRRGFGLKMIEQSVSGQLGGRLEIGGGTGGLACTISLPASRYAAEA